MLPDFRSRQREYLLEISQAITQELDLDRVLEKLPEEQRTALIFREVEGLSYQEMAEVMNCSMGTVMSRLHYSRKKMQDLLRGYLKGGGKA